jgi:hypothetical protein
MMRRTSIRRCAAAVVAAGSLVAVVALPTEAAPAPPQRIHIVKTVTGPSCTGYSSQISAPATIRVLLHASFKIVTVPFEQYVKDTLPHEWITSWAAESLKAGAVAVKSYGWYWTTHLGGYLDTPGNCFDVTDDSSFQVYKANTGTPSTDAAVEASWTTITRKNSQVLQAAYACTLPFVNGKTDCSTQGPKEKCGAGVNGSQLSQWGSQACAKQGMSYQNILKTYYGATLQLAGTTPNTRQLLTPNDFTFSGKSTPAVWDPVTGMWTLSSRPGVQYQWGLPGDIPAITNSGDGRALVGVWRPSAGLWYVKDVLSGGWTRTQLGQNGDIPVAAHYDGIDQPTVLTTFRPSDGRWYRVDGTSQAYGQNGDVPVPGHYAGSAANDYADTPAVWRPSTGQWLIVGPIRAQWGTAGDIPVPADYNGDGTTDIAVYRPSTQRWYISGTPSFQWGLPGDIPVTGDFNGDGKADVVVFRPSTQRWYVRGTPSFVFGSARSIPAGRAPYTD